MLMARSQTFKPERFSRVSEQIILKSSNQGICHDQG